MNQKTSLILLCCAALLSSCSDKGWGVSGTIANAPEGAKVSVEGFNAGLWYSIDSVAISKDGKFNYVSQQGSPYPDIYRVSLDGKSIYFPIDSLEHVSISADANAFDTSYSLSGWTTAEEMMKIDQQITNALAEKGAAALLNDSVFKRELGIAINDDESGILGYYIINKTVGGQPLFSPDNRKDLAVLGALANKFLTKYPNDPRTEYICQRYLQARSQFAPAQSGVQIQAQEAGIFEIELYDPDGNKRKLTDVAKDAGLTVLSFTSYLMDGSIAYNVELNRIYEMFKDRNIAIYQVSLDSDELAWRTNATSMPWTAVWYDGTDGGNMLRMYNVSAIPTTYIIDKNGDIVDRVDNPADLESKVKKHI